MGNLWAKLVVENASDDLLVSTSGSSKGKASNVADVNLLSYNLFIRPPMINNNGNDYKDERLSEFLKEMHKYDIICLQEMFGVYSRRRAIFLEQAREAGFLFQAESPKPSTLSKHFIDGGLCIISRYPIIVSEFCPYPWGVGVDHYVQKGVLYAQIAVGNSKLHLYNSHTQANYANHLNDFLKRSEQYKTFQQFMKSSLSKNGHREDDMVIIVGDLNVDSRSKVRFESQALIDAPALEGLDLLKKTESFSEYDAILSFLSDNHKDGIEDLVYRDLGEHPVTFGESYINEDNEIRPRETVLTTKKSVCTNQSLDYIFRYVPKKPSSKKKRNQKKAKPQAQGRAAEKLYVLEGSATVEPFFVKGHVFQQLSDHYGVKVTLQYMKSSLRAERQSSASTNSSPSKATKSLD